MSTEILSLNEIVESQASKYITHNTALRQLEAQLVRVLSKTTTAQPGSPANGNTYIIPASATGTDWAGQDGKIGHFYSNAWVFYAPIEGQRLWVNNENREVVYEEGAWLDAPGSAVGLTVHDMASDADYTLTASQAFNRILKITDSGVLLSAARNIIVPAQVREFVFWNATAQSLTFKTSAGTGMAVAAGAKGHGFCDGVNVEGV